MTPEGRIESYLRRRVLAAGGRIRKVRWLDRRGAPDRLIWWKGPRMLFVECKASGMKPTVLQEREHERLRADGFRVEVIDSFEQVDALIAEFAPHA